MFSNISKRKRERDEGVGVGEIGETHVFNINYRFFSEDISNHPLGVYTVNDSFREKVIFDEIMWKWLCNDVIITQPRSQGLSSLPPLVVGRKTLVAAGHMTTQNLGGKKVCWVGGVAEYFIWLMWKTLWVSNPLAFAKNYSLFRGSKSNLPMMNATWFLPSSKYRRLSFTKKFGSRMERNLFDG